MGKELGHAGRTCNRAAAREASWGALDFCFGWHLDLTSVPHVPLDPGSWVIHGVGTPRTTQDTLESLSAGLGTPWVLVRLAGGNDWGHASLYVWVDTMPRHLRKLREKKSKSYCWQPCWKQSSWQDTPAKEEREKPKCKQWNVTSISPAQVETHYHSCGI